MTAALGMLLILGASALSASTCWNRVRAPQRQTSVRTLVSLLAATVIACAGASLIAVAADTVPTILAFALGAAGVTGPVVLGLAAGPRADRDDLG